MGFEDVVSIFGSGIRLGVPLVLACLAGLWSERSGVVDIGLEGKILTGAFAGAVEQEGLVGAELGRWPRVGAGQERGGGRLGRPQTLEKKRKWVANPTSFRSLPASEPNSALWFSCDCIWRTTSSFSFAI